MKPKIGLSQKELNGVTVILEKVLANAVTVYTKTRKFHWNVCGESFMELHKLFQSQYKLLEESIDVVAERMSKLGSKIIGTMKEFEKLSAIKEYPGKYPSSKEMILELLNDHETIIVDIRKSIIDCSKNCNDVGTIDLLTSLIQEHETIAWTLRRYSI